MDWSRTFDAQKDDLASMLARGQVNNSALFKVAQELQGRKDQARQFDIQEHGINEAAFSRRAQQESLNKDREGRAADRKDDNDRADRKDASAALQRHVSGMRKGDMVTPETQVQLVKEGMTGFASGAGGDQHTADPHFHVAAPTAMDNIDENQAAVAARDENTARHQGVMEQAALISANKPSGGGPGGGLTTNQEAIQMNRLREAYNKVSQGARTMQQQRAMMKSGLEAFARGERNAATQAVITTFNKIMDPNSVVRESEYDRSPAGMALLERMRGLYPKLSEGGVGMTSQGLQEFATLADQWTAGAEKALGPMVAPILAQADHFGIDHSFIKGGPSATAPAAPASDPVLATPAATPAAVAPPAAPAGDTKIGRFTVRVKQ